MAIPTEAIETAFIARLRGDTTLQGLLTGATSPLWNIFDANGVPTNQPFPYVVVFPIMTQLGEDLSFGTDARDTFVQASAFTMPGASGGMKQARDIMGRIDALFFSEGKGIPLDLSSSGFNQYLILPDNAIERPDEIVPSIDVRWKLQTQG
jgi:hypothetical protein